MPSLITAGFCAGAGCAGIDALFPGSVSANSTDVLVGSAAAPGSGCGGDVEVDVGLLSSLVVEVGFDGSSVGDPLLGSFDFFRKIDLNLFLVCPRTSGAAIAGKYKCPLGENGTALS